MLTRCASQCLVAADWMFLHRWQWWYYSRQLVVYLRTSWRCFCDFTEHTNSRITFVHFQLQKLFLIQQNRLCCLLLVLRWRMAPHYAAVLQTPRRPRAQAWSYIPTKRAMVSAGSPSCTALTVTMTCHQSLYLETRPLSENCELKWGLRDTAVQGFVFVVQLSSLICLASHHLISDMERTWLWLHLLR